MGDLNLDFVGPGARLALRAARRAELAAGSIGAAIPDITAAHNAALTAIVGARAGAITDIGSAHSAALTDITTAKTTAQTAIATDGAAQLTLMDEQADRAEVAVGQTEQTVDDLRLNRMIYNGTDDRVPVITDDILGIIMSYIRSTGVFDLPIAASVTAKGMAGTVGPTMMQMDYNPAGVKPMWTDEAGGILLGLDADNRPMGYMLEGVTGGSPVTVPLPEEFRIELADWNIVLGTGQSLILGTMEISAVYSTTQLYANRCFGSGVKSSKSGNTFGGTLVTPGTSTTKLLVEDALDPYDPPAVRGETVMSSVNHTSYLAARENGIAPSDLVFCASTTGHGGYSIDLLVHGAVWHQQLIDHITEWKARADEVPERTSALWWVDHLQGESDGSMSQLEWGTKTGGYFTDIEGHAASTYGQDFPPHFGIYQLARKGGPQLAIMDLVAARPNVHITTPIYHLPAADNIGHLTGLGYLRYGKYAGRTRKQVMIDKREPDCIWPVSVTAVGQKVTFRYRTPTRLILDTTLLFPTQDMGFAVQDTVGILTLTNIATGKWFAGHDGRGYCDVTMTVNRALVGAWEGRYARDYRGVGLIVDTAVSGNLRDTTMDTFFQGGTEYPLFHVAPSSVLAGVSI